MKPAFIGKLLLCLVSVCVVSDATEDYCQMSCVRGTHTMCQFKQGSIGSKCYKDRKTFNSNETADIVHIHNMIRADVANGKVNSSISGIQPQAADMMQLVWDEELAAIAQRWADQCIKEHDLCRKVGRYPVGQNLASWAIATDFTSQDMYQGIDMWYNEVYELKPGIINSFTESDCDHYTQLVWSTTGAVGCGISTYQSGGDTEYSELLVCNYGPMGNIPSMPVYTQGAPCTACPEGTSCSSKYHGLCFSPQYAKMRHDFEEISVSGTTTSVFLSLQMTTFYMLVLHFFFM